MPTAKTRTETPTRTQDDGPWVSTTEAARILERTPETVLLLGQRGTLRMNRPGRAHPKWPRAEVIALARSNGIDVSKYL